MRDQRKMDAEQLRLLAIFHFIVAGLSLLGLGVLALHYSFMHAFFANPEMWKGQKDGPPPAEVLAIFKWFDVVFGFAMISIGVSNLLSGLFIRRKKHRTFSLVIAGLNCVQIPVGTVLGVFTLVVLLRDSVREAYENGPSQPTDPMAPSDRGSA
jgi:hypothetical protein